MASSRSFTFLIVALIAAMATAFVPGSAVSRGSGKLTQWEGINFITRRFVVFDVAVRRRFMLSFGGRCLESTVIQSKGCGCR